MKRFIAGLLVGLVLALSVPVCAQGVIRLFVNGKEIKPAVPPQIIRGTTMVPLRAVAEALGANVAWDDKDNKVTITTGTASIFTQFDRDIDMALDYIEKGAASNFTYSNELQYNLISNRLVANMKELEGLNLPDEEYKDWKRKMSHPLSTLILYNSTVRNRDNPSEFAKYRDGFVASLKTLSYIFKD